MRTTQRSVAKIHSSKLRKEKWKISATLKELRKHGELVALGDSQMLEWLDELSGKFNVSQEIERLRTEIRRCVKDSRQCSVPGEYAAELKSLREELDSYMFIEDYVLVVMDKKSDFKKLCKDGFTFNGVSMKFLLATVGGVKTSTMIFVPDDIIGELMRRLNNGRNEDKPMMPAKLEAYMALSCSASRKLSAPRGVLVVNDCVHNFKERAITLDDSAGGDPELKIVDECDIELVDSDGYGLMSPELAARWGEELGEDGILPGCNTRCAFEKGMVFPFDFHRFAREVAKTDAVKDVWGNEHRIDDIELILTTSMLKLWDSYDSWDSYWSNCVTNGYGFRATKVCPQQLENERATNYQFLQGYELSDDEIDRLIRPTIDCIKEAMCGDWEHTLIYVKGKVTPERLNSMADDWTKALMIEPLMMNDPYIRAKVKQMLRKRIDDAKIGVIDVCGNYAMISGDPYALCQSIFGMESTGLLSAGECYHKHWTDRGSSEIVVFRAPMSAPNNIRVLKVSAAAEQCDWYRYMTTILILNGWDATRHATNGADCDGDMYMATDNPILLEHAPRLPVIMCAQRQGVKKRVEWDDFALSNIEAAGDDIGAITNRITAMYDKLTLVESEEQREILRYRIQCGQLYQQNAICQ